MRVIALLLLAILSTGCGVFSAPPQPVFRAIVRVEGDPGQPIAGARLAFKAKDVGVTDGTGHVELALKGRDGQVFDLTVTCPNGYRSPTKPVPVTLRKLAATKSLPQFHVQCPPQLRTVVVAVRAVNGPNLPIVFLGRERTRTDQSGAAHLVLQVPPNQSVQLQLDTSGDKNLMPKSPTTSFEVSDKDEVVVVEQTFEVERPRVKVFRGGGGGPRPLRI